MQTINPQYMEAIIRTVNRSPYFQLLSMKLIHFEIGRSLMEIDLGTKHLQPFGMVHGGVFSSIIDAATFWSVYPEAPEDMGMTSVDLKLNYLAPANSGKLIARGHRIKFGRTLGLGAAEITDESGKILAHGTSTLMVLPDVRLVNGEPLPPKFIEEA